MPLTCAQEGRYGIAHTTDVQLRPRFDAQGQQPLCAYCWEQYQDMIYRMWESHH